MYASAAYRLHMHYDPLDSMRPAVIFRHGQRTYFQNFGGTQDRWGDYSSSCVDPTNNTDFWTIQEYAAAHSTDPLRGWWDSHDRFATWFDRVNSQKTPPIVITNMITSVTAFSATGGVNVTDDGGATVTARGVCWSKNAKESHGLST